MGCEVGIVRERGARESIEASSLFYNSFTWHTEQQLKVLFSVRITLAIISTRINFQLSSKSGKARCLRVIWFFFPLV